MPAMKQRLMVGSRLTWRIRLAFFSRSSSDGGRFDRVDAIASSLSISMAASVCVCVCVCVCETARPKISDSDSDSD
jgi:hypothetical protein